MTDKEIFQSLCEILISNDRDRWCELVENGTKKQQKDFLFNKEKHCFSALFDKYISLQEKLDIAINGLNKIYDVSEYGMCGEIAQEALAKIKEIK